AWGRLAAIPGAGPLATCLERAGASGIPAAEQMAQLATECRAEWARTAKERAHRAGVLMAAPLGLCLLPAFLVVGVVPVVIGLASGILGGG
ncbi:type II secretion system F family protein, partial [Streptomyces sp. T-3]|nr:type II secretion system F family protein [Streptomyces sp. T-3]